MSEGDYESDRVIVERKTIDDLYGSIIGSKDKKGRLPSQLSRLTTHQSDKVVIILITGNIDDFVKRMRKIKIKVNRDIIDGMIASIIVRDNIRVLFNEDEKSGLIQMVKIMKKIDEEELDIPKLRNMDALAARLLNISKNQFLAIKDKYGSSLTYIASLNEKDLASIDGMSKLKAKRIKDILHHGWE
mgnify:FL=1|jgi:ERCC4-type nuclease